MSKKIIMLSIFLLLIASCAKKEITGSTITTLQAVAPKIELMHMIGNSNAPIEVIEYSDFECPYSKQFYNEILPGLKRDYIDTGRVKLIFRNLPLNSVHPNAHKAAEAAECAGMQGKFWEMHDYLFSHGVSGGVEDFKSYALNISLNPIEFNSCLDTNNTRQKVKDDFYSGINLGVKGTPSFVVNGTLAPPLRSYEEFSNFLESFTR
jgi:protein-disulfide isomerase